MSAHAHAPGHSHDHEEIRAQGARRLALVLGFTSLFLVVEVVGGVLTGSLALLADAGHMLSDVVALALALGAVWLAGRPATPERSFGYRRAEILAALANAVTLVVVSIWIFIEAFRRVQEPPEVVGGWLLVVAIIGLLVNLAGVWVLHGGREASLNVSAAFRHVLADLLGSVGVIAAAIVILTTGWRYADPLIGALIGLLVLASSWGILRDSVRILLEAAPKGLDADELGRRMAASPGVAAVHDLHVWSITQGFPALSAHVLVDRHEDCHLRRRELERLLAEEYGIEHTTLQVDHLQTERRGLQIR